MKRTICVLLALCFVISVLPLSGYAANGMEPILVHDGDTLTLHGGWASVTVPVDGLYRFELTETNNSGGVFAIYQIPEDTSGYTEEEIAYIKADLRVFVYDLMLDNAKTTIQAAETSISESAKAHEQAVKDHEAQRRSYNLQIQYQDQIKTLISQYGKVESSGQPPFGFFSVQDYYLRSVRPRLLTMGFDAPEDSSALWKAQRDSLDELAAFEQAEKNLPLFEEQYQQALNSLETAKQQVKEFEKECEGPHAEYKKAKAALKEPYPNTDDYLLLNWGIAGFDYLSINDDSCYWLMKDGMGDEMTFTVSQLYRYSDTDDWPKEFPGMHFENGSYVLVMRSDGEQRTYYNGILMETQPDENGVVTIPEAVDDMTVTEIGANAFSGNDSIKAVYIPSTVSRIQTDAFHDCDQLKDVYYDGTQEEWNKVHISSGNESLSAAVLHVKEPSEASASPEPAPDTSSKPEPTSPPAQEKQLPFRDVPKTAWFYPNVVSVWEQGIMKGQKNDLFAPQSSTTRAEFATVIYRIAKGSVSDKASPFEDVKKTDWFHDAVVWAFENGVVKGIDASHFDPNAPVTREQVVTMLCRFASGKGSGNNLSRFSDDAMISDYARLPVSWAVEEKILTGTDLGTINPQGHTTRAEMAAILDRYLSK